eukprot:488373-Rhodomonas_salina.1
MLCGFGNECLRTDREGIRDGGLTWSFWTAWNIAMRSPDGISWLHRLLDRHIFVRFAPSPSSCERFWYHDATGQYHTWCSRHNASQEAEPGTCPEVSASIAVARSTEACVASEPCRTMRSVSTGHDASSAHTVRHL